VIASVLAAHESVREAIDETLGELGTSGNSA
jgi:hypothetical protein